MIDIHNSRHCRAQLVGSSFATSTGFPVMGLQLESRTEMNKRTELEFNTVYLQANGTLEDWYVELVRMRTLPHLKTSFVKLKETLKIRGFTGRVGSTTKMDVVKFNSDPYGYCSRKEFPYGLYLTENFEYNWSIGSWQMYTNSTEHNRLDLTQESCRCTSDDQVKCDRYLLCDKTPRTDVLERFILRNAHRRSVRTFLEGNYLPDY